jgi:hypothetical protein
MVVVNVAMVSTLFYKLNGMKLWEFPFFPLWFAYNVVVQSACSWPTAINSGKGLRMWGHIIQTNIFNNSLITINESSLYFSLRPCLARTVCSWIPVRLKAFKLRSFHSWPIYRFSAELGRTRLSKLNFFRYFLYVNIKF